MKKTINEECLSFGYNKCLLIKNKIDEILELNSIDRTNTGLTTSKEEKEQVKLMERQRLLSVRHLDPAKIDRLLETDND